MCDNQQLGEVVADPARIHQPIALFLRWPMRQGATLYYISFFLLVCRLFILVCSVLNAVAREPITDSNCDYLDSNIFFLGIISKMFNKLNFLLIFLLCL